MKSIIAILLLASICSAELLREAEFKTWASTFNKKYPSEAERTKRLRIFSGNMAFIEEYNAHREDYNSAFLRMNEFGDLTIEEFHAMYLQASGSAPRVAASSTHQNAGDRPAKIDWRTKNAVTPVKNQGQCGSCWAFSATGTIEGAWAIATGQLVPLSEQNLMDCSWKYDNEGCNGGWMQAAQQYVVDNKGIDTEKSYPYTGKSSKTCKYSDANKGASISSYVNVTMGNEADLQDAIGNKGPVSVAIDASHFSFQFYGGGVYDEKKCKNDMNGLDHGVLAVGYDSKDGKDYYIVKNSWGASWGQSGYIWMSRNKNNQCGIATAASYPIV